MRDALRLLPVIVRNWLRTLAHALRVRLWLQADIQSPEIDFRFTPKTGHSVTHAGLPFVTHNGNRRRNTSINSFRVPT